MSKPPRSYDQFCPVAVSLDVLGDRWTILLLRDLLWSGPLRFNEISDRNPGLSSSVLTERLRDLDGHGLIEQIDEPKRRYRLTAAGERISDVIDALYGFGLPLIVGARVSPAMFAYAVADCERRRRLDLLDVAERALVQVTIDDADALVEAAPGSLRVATEGTPTAHISCDGATLAALLGGLLNYREAVASASLRITGDEHAAEVVVGLLRAADEIPANT